MKRTALLLVAALAVNLGFAQSAKVVSAYNYLRNNQLDKAREAIEPAISHEKTMGDPKTWFYRGNVYLAIQLAQEPEFQALKTNALQISEESYNKALELDAKEQYKPEILQRYPIIAEQYYNQGVLSYNSKDYPGAMQQFLRARDLNLRMGIMDSLAMYNAGLCAELSGQPAVAKENYQRLVELNYSSTLIYSSLANMYKEDKDTAAAYAILAKGLASHPDDYNLIISQTNLFLADGEMKKAQANLERAIALDASNPTIFFAVGTTYDQMGEKEKAESAYKAAINLDPAYFDANYNLGALYVNDAAAILEATNQLPLGDPKYD
ncbi:MAG: tetratricopeptide repeat protein, partial [Bacteroidales bacterium]|nr:tetratricopeptide repeat protein [Bacteroidales bacterium]